MTNVTLEAEMAVESANTPNKTNNNTAQSMNAESDYLQRSQERITELQQQVAERERATQNKAKELLAREQQLKEQQELLEKREQIFEARQHRQRLANRNRASLVAPLLLITCVAAGYFAYEQIDQQRQYFQQVKVAEAHVDKLTRVLSITQERMVSNTSTIAERNTQLAQTQAKLEALESELAKLQDEESEVAQQPSLLNQLLMEKELQGASLEIPQTPASDLR